MVHCSLTLSLTKEFTMMEEYSGVFTQHLTDHQPITSTLPKSGSELAASVDDDPQICFIPQDSKRLKRKEKGMGGASSEFFRATFLVAQLYFVRFYTHPQQKCSIILKRTVCRRPGYLNSHFHWSSISEKRERTTFL